MKEQCLKVKRYFKGVAIGFQPVLVNNAKVHKRNLDMPTKSTLIAIALLAVSFFIFPWELFLGIAGGLVIGWNVLEQPAIVRKYWDKATKKISALL